MRFSIINVILTCICIHQNTLGFNFNNAKVSNLIKTRATLQMKKEDAVRKKDDVKKGPNKRDRSLSGIISKLVFCPYSSIYCSYHVIVFLPRYCSFLFLS